MADYSELKRLAEAATPQNFDTAEQKIESGYIECPHCSGQGEVELEADYCNYDGAPMGVQFYGIGNEFGAAEAYYRAASPAAVLEMIARIDLLQKAYSENIVDQVTCKAAGYLMAKAESMTLGNRYREPGQEIDQLKAEVARLAADNASLRGSCAKLGDEHAGMVRTVRKQAAELEGLRKDAGRYRWLMSPAIMNGTLGIPGGWIDFEFKEDATQQIDEAMSAEGRT